ncbi:MAG: LeuA family protein [Candidatus Obscuribacterales bacterium]|nr:LeuA family protein [Candidatus Obscuribacterales bacterium]
MTVKIIDATLREGMQAPGVNFNAEQSLYIARALAAIGVDMVECGHPLKSAEEMARVRALTGGNLGIPVLAHSRAKREDIAAVAESGAQWVGVFVGINHTTRTARLRNCTVADILAIIRDTVGYAKSLGLKVRYTVEDASRTSMPELQRAYAEAVEAGADRICYADTVGLLEPGDMKAVVKPLKLLFPATDLEIHIHDDRGLAMACTLAAMDAGANWMSTSVNGLGERCGITDTLTLLANMHHRLMRKIPEPGVNAPSLRQVSQIVAEMSEQPVDARRPVGGQHAFTHKARLHRLAMERDRDAYTWINPDVVGGNIQLVED